jgi:luciferase family oxidoreductase group 1
MAGDRSIPISVLDWAPVRAGETPREALQQAVDLARHVEALGFKRFWLAEHHGAAIAASAATSVVIGHIAGQTSTLRVGSGGVMLPNHPPLMVAEQFGTLASLYPGRIDLGLGRASGTAPGDDATLRALRQRPDARDRFPADVRELQSYFGEAGLAQDVRAAPGAGLDVPVWLLGSSSFSAGEAAALGLPFAFAAHIAPAALDAAVRIYRSGFRPSAALARPHLMVSVLVVAAETDRAARRLVTSIQQAVIALLHGRRSRLPPPTDDPAVFADPDDRAKLQQMMPYAIVGSPETVRDGIEALIARTDADELTILSFVHDQEARHRSFDIIAGVRAWAAPAG